MPTSIAAPAGSHFEYESVKTERGTKDLGEKPILVWDELQAMRDQFTDEGVLAVADGTSLRVSYQNIARRFAAAGKSDDEIATAQVAFRPGKRQVGASTPASRTARAAKAAVEKNPAQAEAIEKLLAAIASGKYSDDDLKALAG